MPKLISLATLILLFALTSKVGAQQPKSSDPIAKVAVSISGSENLKGEVKSYLSRELRSLNDVLVSEQDPDYEMDAIVLELATLDYSKVGVAISVNVLKPLKSFRRVANERGAPYDSSFSIFIFSWLRVGNSSDLRLICQGLIADFDNQVLDHDRKRINR